MSAAERRTTLGGIIAAGVALRLADVRAQPRIPARATIGPLSGEHAA